MFGSSILAANSSVTNRPDIGGKFPIGTAAPVTPRWEPAGRWIAYLKREHGLTQVWRVDVGTGAANQVTNSLVNVDDFRITEDGRTGVYSSRPKLPEKSAEIDQAGLRGWRFDARGVPGRGRRATTRSAAAHLGWGGLE